MAITLMFVWKILSESHDHQNNSALGIYCITVTLKYPVNITVTLKYPVYITVTVNILIRHIQYIIVNRHIQFKIVTLNIPIRHIQYIIDTLTILTGTFSI